MPPKKYQKRPYKKPYRKKKRWSPPPRTLEGHKLHITLYPKQKILLPFFGILAILLSLTAFINPYLVILSVPFWGIEILLFIQFLRTKHYFTKHHGIEELRKMDPFVFEEYSLHLLKRLGYTGYNTPTKRDFGADFVVFKNGIKYAGQCKRYAAHNSITSEMMQQFIGSMTIYKAQKGIYITTSSYTPDAKMLGEKNGVECIDAVKLAKII